MDLALEAKVGQLLMVGYPRREITPFLRNLISEYNLGGVIHFARNVGELRRFAELNAELQELAGRSPSGAPLFSAVDQEGGTIARLTQGLAVAPSAMALGAAGSPELTKQVCAAAACDLRAVGINMNLAPVVDVNSNPHNPVIGVRSFGEDPHLVASLGAAAIRGYQRYLAAVAKHFPGHGDVDLDPHHHLPVLSHGRQRLEEIELVPFRAAVAAGVAGIMAAHVVFPALESREKLPASLSPRVLTGLLREELGYEGLIITDCMEMAAIKQTVGTVEGAVQAIAAGADLAIISHSEDLQAQALQALVAAVREGRIPEERIDQSLQRILKLKRHLARQLDLKPGGPEHVEIMREAIRRSITLVRDGGNLPLGGEPILVVEFQEQAATQAEDVLLGVGTLARALQEKGSAKLQAAAVGSSGSDQELAAVLAQARQAAKVLVVTSDAHRNPAQVGLVGALLAEHGRVIVVGSRTPYELQAFPEVPTYIAAYGSRPLVWDVVAEVLLGKAQAGGRLPVSIPGLT
ncbi:MAG: glycoside hydrolase family 3 N-terminal domain-containing protein [Limnochordia bacterium]|jgi:beta-N-acetylhexosaminidase|nr:glycoside hydrolase family 3 protein [Bacillota bacterium]HOK30447.1 glycoside hydrolase family 3 N-terminal domain-containing protein [Limnochordia bacterium]HOL99311.1 glycoside hydrolase family 3 N-terminal domain-containing protein [Limnochordia bacterium]HPP71325.1 glycoside hydrolase family 3 N-terminal domain-containing protein [Limnochordia bacterium]HQE35703.1 glycoside hydrolase family 3 N-terminal domain-containing protein [Limnochordia bacterium]